MKYKKAFRIYTLTTQFLLNTFGLTLLGIYFGWKLDVKYDTGDLYSGLLGILGIIIGLSTFIFFVLKSGDRK